MNVSQPIKILPEIYSNSCCYQKRWQTGLKTDVWYKVLLRLSYSCWASPVGGELRWGKVGTLALPRWAAVFPSVKGVAIKPAWTSSFLMIGFVIVKHESYRNCLNTAFFIVYIINYVFLETLIQLLKIKCTEFGQAYRNFWRQ